MRTNPIEKIRSDGLSMEAIRRMDAEAVAAGALECEQLEQLLLDSQHEPDWRTDADLNAAYFDGHQKTDEQKRLEKEGQPVAVVNLIARSINSMLGQEAKARTDWRVSSDTDEMGDVADALQVKLKEAQRETNADMAISEAYGSQCKAGLGWVEVSRVSNPFARYRYRVKPIHRNEIWWDWRAQELDLSDAAWLLRKRWYDLRDAEAQWPQFAEIFRFYGRANWRALALTDILGTATKQVGYQRVAQNFRVRSDEWLDTGRKRIRIYEVWYRVWKPAMAMVFADGSPAMEFQPTNPVHQAAIASGVATLEQTQRQVLRTAMYIGPHRVKDVETTAKNFPYIPFWGFREDDSRAPYSPVQGMRYPQDEYNARRSRLMWLLQAAQVFVDDDALSTKYNNLASLADEIMRPDALVVLNAQRRNGANAIRVERSVQMPREQTEVMQDAKQLIQEQPGIYTAMLGDAPTGVTSGLAINSLVEQGSIALGDFNDNYRLGRRLVGEALADLICEDLAKVPGAKVRVGTGEAARTVVLNVPTPEGLTMNAVRSASIKVALNEAPSTPSYRMHQQQKIAEVLQVGGNDPAVRAVLIPAFVETTDLPEREYMARTLRQMYGVPTPGDRKQAEQAAQQQAMEAQQQKAMQMAAQQAELDATAAKTKQANSAAELNQARTAEIVHNMNQPDDPIDHAIGQAVGDAKKEPADAAAE